MKTLDLVKYLTGYDLIQGHNRQERAIKLSSTGREDVLPIECGLEGTLKIFGLRLRTTYGYPLVLASRAIGLDYLYRKIRENYRN